MHADYSFGPSFFASRLGTKNPAPEPLSTALVGTHAMFGSFNQTLV